MTESLPTTQATSTPDNHRQRKIALQLLTCLFLFLGLIWLLYWLIWGQFAEYTDDAYVNGNLVQLMPQIAGTVIEINTDDTQLVLQGQKIIRLDSADSEIALQRAKANLALTVREVHQYFEKAEQTQALLLLRNADLMKAQLDLKRRVGLVRERAISREEWQHYQIAVEVTKAQYDEALHELRAALALVENSHLYTHPMVERAKANLKTAYLNLQRTTIVAPVTGYVAKRNVQVGQQVMLNTPMLAIVPLTEVWVDANYKESQLNNLRINQPVTLYADAYSEMTYHGKVEGLNAGTGAAFSLLPPQNATGNWIKIVQRLPVRIRLDTEELKKNPLQIGLSMRVTTNTHDTSGNKLASTVRQKPLYSTTIYNRQLAHVENLIAHILEENSPNLFLPKIDTLSAKTPRTASISKQRKVVI